MYGKDWNIIPDIKVSTRKKMKKPTKGEKNIKPAPDEKRFSSIARVGLTSSACSGPAPGVGLGPRPQRPLMQRALFGF